MDVFHRQHLNPYINFHRPCAVPKILTEANGKRHRVYLRWATPFELFQEVPKCEGLLRPGWLRRSQGLCARLLRPEVLRALLRTEVLPRALPSRSDLPSEELPCG